MSTKNNCVWPTQRFLHIGLQYWPFLDFQRRQRETQKLARTFRLSAAVFPRRVRGDGGGGGSCRVN